MTENVALSFIFVAIVQYIVPHHHYPVVGVIAVEAMNSHFPPPTRPEMFYLWDTPKSLPEGVPLWTPLYRSSLVKLTVQHGCMLLNCHPSI